MAWRDGRRSIFEKMSAGNGIPLLLGGAVCALILVLVAIVLLVSFLVDFPISFRFSLDNYKSVLNTYLFREVVPNTLIVGLVTVAVSLAFGIPLAWLLHRTNLPYANLFLTLIAVSVIVPGFLKGIGWILLLSPNVGFINRLLMDLFGLENPPFDIGTLTGIGFIQGLMMTSALVFLFSGPMRSLDPSLEEASEISGARRWTTIRCVLVPLLRPAVLGGAIYVFMTAISLFEVAALLGGMGGKNQVLATELFLSIYTLTASVPQYGVSGVYGALIAIPSLVALYYYYVMLQQTHRYVTVTGKGYVARTHDLGAFKYLGVFFVLFYLVLAVFLPLIVLVWASLLPYLQLPSWDALSVISLKSYRRIMNLPGIWKIVSNTVVLTVSVSLWVMILSFMVSWIVTRTKMRIGIFMDSIVMLPHAFPNIGFALALLILALLVRMWFPSVPFYGTVGILVLAHVVTRISYGTRVINAALVQISRELEEAAYICGSKQVVVWWKVILPIISRSLVYLGLWTGLLSFREVSMALMLSGPDNQLLSNYVWTAWVRGDLNVASALGVIMVVVMGAMFLIVQKLGGREARVVGTG
ncbi:MAG: iron ABC transporter permease [Deltaproteobacteria bacterium]|nr:iron ABC transporter permease [Deltaproteobacteria bacterium]